MYVHVGNLGTQSPKGVFGWGAELLVLVLYVHIYDFTRRYWFKTENPVPLESIYFYFPSLFPGLKLFDLEPSQSSS